MTYIISNWSVTDGVRLSVIISKLVYNSLIFGDNKLILICINITAISKSFCPLYTSYLLIWRVLHLWVQMSLRRIGCVTQSSIFTARCYASAILAMGLCLSVCVCPSVRPSVTSRSSTRTAKRRITQTTSHDSPGTLVFWCQRSPWNSTGVTPYDGAECRWGGSKSANFD